MNPWRSGSLSGIAGFPRGSQAWSPRVAPRPRLARLTCPLRAASPQHGTNPWCIDSGAASRVRAERGLFAPRASQIDSRRLFPVKQTRLSTNDKSCKCHQFHTLPYAPPLPDRHQLLATPTPNSASSPNDVFGRQTVTSQAQAMPLAPRHPSPTGRPVVMRLAALTALRPSPLFALGSAACIEDCPLMPGRRKTEVCLCTGRAESPDHP